MRGGGTHRPAPRFGGWRPSSAATTDSERLASWMGRDPVDSGDSPLRVRPASRPHRDASLPRALASQPRSRDAVQPLSDCFREDAGHPVLAPPVKGRKHARGPIFLPPAETTRFCARDLERERPLRLVAQARTAARPPLAAGAVLLRYFRRVLPSALALTPPAAAPAPTPMTAPATRSLAVCTPWWRRHSATVAARPYGQRPVPRAASKRAAKKPIEACLLGKLAEPG